MRSDSAPDSEGFFPPTYLIEKLYPLNTTPGRVKVIQVCFTRIGVMHDMILFSLSMMMYYDSFAIFFRAYLAIMYHRRSWIPSLKFLKKNTC